MKANFILYSPDYSVDGPDVFFKKFKRKFKQWTIDELHDLWMRASNRAAIRQKEKSDFIDTIVERIPKDSRGRHIVYFHHRNDIDNVHQYEFSWHEDWRSYGISQNRLKMDTRDDKLSFIIDNDIKFEFGQKYHHLDFMSCKVQYYVKDILWKVVEKELVEKFKGKTPPDIFILKIGSKKYFIELDEQHRYGYLRFHMKNEYVGETISI